MKKNRYFLVLALVLTILKLSANSYKSYIYEQEIDTLTNKLDTVAKDTIQIRLGGLKILILKNDTIIERDTSLKIKRTVIPNHWTSINYGINGYLNSKGDFNLMSPENVDPKEMTSYMEVDYRKSMTFSFNIFQGYINLYKHHIGLVTGLGFEWNNYELKNNVKLNPNGGAFVYNVVNEYNKRYTWGEIDTNVIYSKNRFKQVYLTIPLLFDFTTNSNYYLSFGAIAGLNLRTKMKYIYNIDSNTQKIKDKQSFNTNPFKIALTARIGHGGWGFFATYNLTTLFEENKGPELYPFTLGISMNINNDSF